MELALQRYYKKRGGKEQQKLRDKEPDKEQIKIWPKVNYKQYKTK